MWRAILSLLLLTAVNFRASADTLIQWNFNSDPPDGSSSTGTLVPSTGAGTASVVGGATSAYFGGATTDGAADNTALSTSSYPAQGTGNKTRGVQFNVSTLGFESIVISWQQRNTATSTKYTRVQYSID